MNAQSKDMQEFEWVGRGLIGIFGTLLSIAFEQISIILSICTALMTMTYLFFHIRLLLIRIKRENGK